MKGLPFGESRQLFIRYSTRQWITSIIGPVISIQ